MALYSSVSLFTEYETTPATLLNEDNSHTKLSSRLITRDLPNEVGQRVSSCIREFTESIYLDPEVKANWLFVAAERHFPNNIQEGEVSSDEH